MPLCDFVGVIRQNRLQKLIRISKAFQEADSLGSHFDKNLSDSAQGFWFFEYYVSTRDVFFLFGGDSPSGDFPIFIEVPKGFPDVFTLVNVEDEATDKVLIEEELLELFDDDFGGGILLELEKEFDELAFFLVGIFMFNDSDFGRSDFELVIDRDLVVPAID